MAYNILLIYFVILSCFDIFIITHKKNKFLILVLAFLGYLFFFGFRGFIAWDWSHYYPRWLGSVNIFEAIENDFRFNIDKYLTYEKGYQIWMSVLKVFFSNWNIYLFFTTLIDTICLLTIFYKYSPYPIFSMFLFLGFGGIQLQLDLMRNMKAILIFLFSIEFLIKNKKIKNKIMVIMSSFLHFTSLIYLIILPFLKKNLCKYKKILLFIFLFGIIFLIFSDSILYEILKLIKEFFNNFENNIFNRINRKLYFYLNNDFASAKELSLGFIERILTFLLFYIYREKISKDKYGTIFFNIFLLYMISYLYGSGVRIIFERLGLLFVCSYWIVYPILLKNISKLKKILIFSFLILFCTLKINKSYVFNVKARELYKYQNILWNKETYEEKYKIYKKVFERYDRNKKREQN